MLELKVASALRDVDRGAWDELASSSSFYSSTTWLQMIESIELVNHEPAYHQVWDGDRLVGALPSYRVLKETSTQYSLDTLAGGHWSGRSVLLGGNRRAYVNEWLVDPGLTGERRSEVIRLLGQALSSRAAETGAEGVLLPFMTHPTMQELRREHLAGYPFMIVAEAEILLPEPSLDDYLGRMPSDRRREIRREMRRFADAGFTLATERLDECAEEAGLLFGNLERRWGVERTDEAATAFVVEHASYLAEASLVFTARREGTLVGFALAFPWGNRLFLRFAGFDYASTEGTFAYFNLTYYEPIKYACEHGFSSVHLGLASLDAKTARGATLTPVWIAELADPDGGPDDLDSVTAAQQHNQATLKWLKDLPRVRQGAFDGPAWSLEGL